MCRASSWVHRSCQGCWNAGDERDGITVTLTQATLELTKGRGLLPSWFCFCYSETMFENVGLVWPGILNPPAFQELPGIIKLCHPSWPNPCFLSIMLNLLSLMSLFTSSPSLLLPYSFSAVNSPRSHTTPKFIFRPFVAL